MALEYPLNVIWYIESRPWQGPDESRPCNGASKSPGFAPVTASRMGTGVAVELERLDAAGQPLPKPEIRKYLLTCGHVVREAAAGVSGWGCLLEEILCWESNRGYIYTSESTRLCGEHLTGLLATVMKISPCGGTAGAVPEAARLPHHDWALLDVPHPDFQSAPAITSWGDPNLATAMRIAGFAGGAGDSSQGPKWRLWRDGAPPNCIEAIDFRLQPGTTPPHGMLALQGPEETRPGMSGGGVFGPRGELLGIHRSNIDIAMTRSAVSASSIRTWLSNRSMRPALSAGGSPVPVPVPFPPPLPSPPGRPPQGLDPVAIGKAKIPFLNRAKLRNALKQLLEDENTFRLLTLTGDQGVGKTFCWHLIKHAAETNRVSPAYYDLAEAQTLEGACISISEQMGLDVDEMRERVLADDPTEARIGVKLAKWLADATYRGRPQRWWLVLDSLNLARPQLDEELVTPLIKQLARDKRFTQLVLITIGKTLPSDPMLDPYILDDVLRGLSRDDVKHFATGFAETMGKKLREEEILEITNSIAGDWQGPFTPDQMQSVRLKAKQFMEALSQ